jgi:DNA-binding CsgD family transcriptional regulator
MTTFSPEVEALLQNALNFGRTYMVQVGEPVSISKATYQIFISDQKKQLKVSWNKNKFMIFANLKTNAFDECISTEEVMGWANNIGVEDYIRKIHYEYLPAYLSWSMGVYELSKELKNNLKPFGQVFQLQLPLLHKSGKYYWCTMQGVPIRFDKDKNMAVHFNIYQRMEEMTEFNHRLFQPFLVEKVEIMNEWNRQLAAKMKDFVLTPLSEHELETIKLGLEGKTIDQIALKIGKSKNTVMGYNKKILKRGQQIGGKVFKDAEDVGRYFRKMEWV